MTSKEIITNLIDEHKITGEEAYVLMNDVLKGELTNVWTLLNDKTSTVTPSTWPTLTPSWLYSSTTTGNAYDAASTISAHAKK